jgi:hypothetical protein
MTTSIHHAKRANSVASPFSSFTTTPIHDTDDSSRIPSPPRLFSLSGPTSKGQHQTQTGAPRKLSRKLPPALTESLIALERFETITTSEEMSSTSASGSGSGSDQSHYDFRRESEQSCSCSSVQTLTPSNGGGHWNPGPDFAKYTLVVEPPSSEMIYPTPYQYSAPMTSKPKRVVARHQLRVEPRIVDVSRSSLESNYDDLSTPLSPIGSRATPSPSPSLFMSNWPSRRPQTPVVEQAAPPSLTTDTTASTSAWSALHEFEAMEKAEKAKPKVKESRKEKKIRQKAEKASFDAETPPALRDLFNASLCEVIDEHGEKTKFGDLVTGKRTIVIFIRHCKCITSDRWTIADMSGFCPLCAQYMNSILADVPLSALEEADVDLIIIGNGSHKMLNGYKSMSSSHWSSRFLTI